MASIAHMTDNEIKLEPSATDKVSAQYEVPAAEPFVSFEALKARIRHHYELASDYYYSLWYAV